MGRQGVAGLSLLRFPKWKHLDSHSDVIRFPLPRNKPQQLQQAAAELSQCLAVQGDEVPALWHGSLYQGVPVLLFCCQLERTFSQRRMPGRLLSCDAAIFTSSLTQRKGAAEDVPQKGTFVTSPTTFTPRKLYPLSCDGIIFTN